MAPARLRSRGGKRTRAVGTAIPLDLLYEILLCLPASAACRCRAVCKSWCALLSSRRFVAAHAARHRTLLIAGAPYASDPRTWHIDLVDMAGNIVRRTRTADDIDISNIVTCGSLACVIGTGSQAYVPDPATGARTDLPRELSERGKQLGEKFHAVAYAFGRAASPGEYKVLRFINVWSYQHWVRMIEVLTLGNSSGSGKWRGVPDPHMPIEVTGSSKVTNGVTVVDSVVYFVDGMQSIRLSDTGDGSYIATRPIDRFNLETEEWMSSLRGPLRKQYEVDDPDQMLHVYHPPIPLPDLTELEGFLVVTARSEGSQPPSIDLWFLTDAIEETWVKKCSIQVQLCSRRREFYVHPLFLLDGRKIVLSVHPKGVLLVYDLQKGSTRDFDVKKYLYVACGLYKGCLLSLGHVDNE